MWELDYKESWTLKNWCFWTVVLEKTLEGPLDSKAIQPVHPKGNQSWNQDNHDGVITDLEPDILECEIKWALESITTNKASAVMEFQLSYFKSPKMMLWKCCIQYASKFGKLCSGHRTGKGQFSFFNSSVQPLSHVRLFATPWTVAHQAPPSIGFSRQEHWSVLPFPSPGDLPHPGIEPRSPALQADALTSELPGKQGGLINLYFFLALSSPQGRCYSKATS